MRQRVNILAAILVATVSGAAFGGIMVVYPGDAHHTHESFCPHGDGWSHLAPDPVENDDEFFLLGGVSQEARDELADGDTDFPGWAFDYDTKWGSANGTLNIDVYESYFWAEHNSGGRLQGRYNKVAGDPDNLRWIQYAVPEQPFDPDGDGPIPPADGGLIDPYPNDGTDGGPFYLNSDEIGDYTGGADGFGPYDLKFYDAAHLPHPPTSSNGACFELYLVSWDGNNTVNFLDGIQWGFHGECVPEPASFALLALGGLAALRRRRMRSA